MISDEKIRLPTVHNILTRKNTHSYEIPAFITGTFIVKCCGLTLCSREESMDEFWDFFIENNRIHFNPDLLQSIYLIEDMNSSSGLPREVVTLVYKEQE
jgi:hypothetical protein